MTRQPFIRTTPSLQKRDDWYSSSSVKYKHVFTLHSLRLSGWRRSAEASVQKSGVCTALAQGSMRCSPHTAVTFSRLRELLSCGCALCASVALRGAALVTFIQTACCLCGFSLSGTQPLQFSCNPSACFLFSSFFL